MRIFSGIQPTGRKHIGNYIAAVNQYVAGQDRGEAFYCIVDVLATTTYQPASASQLQENVRDVAAILLAAGVDPSRCVLFRQSDVPEHSELAVLLASVTAVADLNDMHKSRGKSPEQRDSVTLGQFIYPIIVAADALAYRADEVLGGDDQRYHVDLMRTIAGRFNGRYGDTLVAPQVRLPRVGAQIADLQHPERKMSTTSESEQGTIHILDEPAAIRAKLSAAATEAGCQVARSGGPGISNLIEIMAAVRGTDAESIELEFSGHDPAVFKEVLAEQVIAYLAPVRDRYRAARVEAQDVLCAGAKRAQTIARLTVAEVRDAMGLSGARSR